MIFCLASDGREDELLADIFSREGRILLTRDRGLLMRGIVTYGYYVRQTNPQKQLVELWWRFALKGGVAPLQRCLRCNGLLVPVAKGSISIGYYYKLGNK